MVRDCEHHFFVNRSAGQGRALEIARRMSVLYSQLGINKFFIHYSDDSVTEIDGDLRSLIDSPGKKVIYSFGGDGTLTNIVNVIAPYIVKDKTLMEKISLCVIPGGTGNDFYRMLGTHFSEQPIDLIKVNNGARYAIGVVSIGLDVAAASYANLIKKEWSQKEEDIFQKGEKRRTKHGDPYMAGIIKVIKEGSYFSAQTISYVDSLGNNNIIKPNSSIPTGIPLIDDSEKSELCVPNHRIRPVFTTPLIAVCNGVYYGNKKPIGKGAKIDDGLLDMIYPDNIDTLKLLRLLIRLLFGFHKESSYVHSNLIKEIRIQNPHTAMAVNHDGEIVVYSDEVIISVVEKGLIVDDNFSELGKDVEKEIQKIFKRSKRLDENTFK